jgi:glutaredoxin
MLMKKVLEEIKEKFEEIDLSTLGEEKINEIVDNVSGDKSLPIVCYKNTWYGGSSYSNLKNMLLGRKVK